jgi:hypothetical protein
MAANIAPFTRASPNGWALLRMWSANLVKIPTRPKLLCRNCRVYV